MRKRRGAEKGTPAAADRPALPWLSDRASTAVSTGFLLLAVLAFVAAGGGSRGQGAPPLGRVPGGRGAGRGPGGAGGRARGRPGAAADVAPARAGGPGGGPAGRAGPDLRLRGRPVGRRRGAASLISRVRGAPAERRPPDRGPRRGP